MLLLYSLFMKDIGLVFSLINQNTFHAQNPEDKTERQTNIEVNNIWKTSFILILADDYLILEFLLSGEVVTDQLIYP